MRRYTTLRQLNAFQVLASAGSFTAAAQELHITQPTLSMQIKKLSDAAGVALYEQIGKKIYITDAGREILKTAQEIFASLARFEMRVASMKGLTRGSLSLAAVTTGEYFIPRLLGVFAQRYPGVKISLKIINREMLIHRMVDNADDLYILDQLPTDMEVEATPFLDNPLLLVAAPTHPLAGRRDISPEVLAREKFLLRESGAGTRIALGRYLRRHELTLDPLLELGSNEAIKQAAIGGLGLAVLSIFAVRNELHSGELITLDVRGFPLMEKWYVAYPKGKQLSIVAHTFLDYLIREIVKLDPAGAQPQTEVSTPSRPPVRGRKTKAVAVKT